MISVNYAYKHYQGYSRPDTPPFGRNFGILKGGVSELNYFYPQIFFRAFGARLGNFVLNHFHALGASNYKYF